MSGKPPYPTQPAYPTQPQGNYAASYGYPQHQMAQPQQYSQQGYAPAAPPPYSQVSTSPLASAPPPQGVATSAGAPPPYTQYPYAQGGYAAPPQPVQAVNMYPTQAVPQSMMARGTFDSGARFDGASQPNIPPPPPGYMPNQAQMASMQGQPVVTHQRQENWFTGGDGGGYTFW